MNPEQMRALADRAHAERRAFGFRTVENDLEDALRAAADQLEAVPTRQQIERIVVNYGYDRAFTVHGNCIDLDDLVAYGEHVADAILTADTAPQELEQWTTTTEYAYGALDAPDIIVPTGEDIDDLGTARYNAGEFWIDVLQRTVKRGPWQVVPAEGDR